MQQQDFEQFGDVMASLCDLYGKSKLSEFALSLWWGAMEHYTLREVQVGLTRHIQNPDNGQFFPKPADVTRAIGGTTADSAALAWSKVDRAVRSVGGYQDVAFDDAYIHAAIVDMGGWITLCSKNDSEWPFVQREFENRYRGYATRRAVPEYLPVLIGIASASNEVNRHQFRPELRHFKNKPVLIGNPEKAQLVIAGGVECDGAVKITRLSGMTELALKLLEVSK
jgi:hypothetical protein